MSRVLTWDGDGALWPNREASRFIEDDGLRWHVQVMGQGPVVLLLHGTGSSSHSWGPVAKLLSERYTVVVPDMPGHAFSFCEDQSRLSLPGMAQSLGTLLRKLDFSPEAVIGHSAGAAVFCQMRLDGLFAPKAFVSINGAILPLNGLAGRMFSPLAKLMVLNPFASSIFTWRAAQSGAVESVLKGTGSAIGSEGLAIYERLFQSGEHVQSTLRMMALWDLDRLKPDLHRLTDPLLLVSAEHDKAISPEFGLMLREIIPGAELETLPGTGHLAHEEQPEAVARLITTFLSRFLLI